MYFPDPLSYPFWVCKKKLINFLFLLDLDEEESILEFPVVAKVGSVHTFLLSNSTSNSTLISIRTMSHYTYHDGLRTFTWRNGPPLNQFLGNPLIFLLILGKRLMANIRRFCL